MIIFIDLGPVTLCIIYISSEGIATKLDSKTKYNFIILIKTAETHVMLNCQLLLTMLKLKKFQPKIIVLFLMCGKEH